MKRPKEKKEFSKTSKVFDDHIKEYKKELRIRKNRLRQFITKDYAEYNADTTIYTLLEITIRNIYEYFTLRHYVFSKTEKMIKSLRRCLDLFDHINKAELENEEVVFFHKHCKIIDKKTDKGYLMEFVWDSPENEKKDKRLIKEAEKDHKDSLQKLFKYIAKHMEEWWD